MSAHSPIPWGEDPVDASITSAMMSDSLDRAGARRQVSELRLWADSRPLRASGIARTIRFVPDPDLDPPHPYDDMMDFIDAALLHSLFVSSPISRRSRDQTK